MDPNLFYLDFGKLLEVIVAIAFLSILVERALAILFESRIFVELVESGKTIIAIRKERKEGYADVNKDKKAVKGLKELISLIIAVLVCFLAKFDAISVSFASNETITIAGVIVTGAMVSGGSKGSIALFKGFIGIMSNTEAARKKAKAAQS